MVNPVPQQIAIELCVSDRDGNVLDAAYIRFRTGKVHRTVEVVDGVLLADLDKHGDLVGLELLGPIRLDDLRQVVPDTEPRDRVWSVLKQRAPEFIATAA